MEVKLNSSTPSSDRIAAWLFSLVSVSLGFPSLVRLTPDYGQNHQAYHNFFSKIKKEKKFGVLGNTTILAIAIINYYWHAYLSSLLILRLFISWGIDLAMLLFHLWERLVVVVKRGKGVVCKVMWSLQTDVLMKTTNKQRNRKTKRKVYTKPSLQLNY